MSESAYERGGLLAMQEKALHLGSRVRQQGITGVADLTITVYGPNNRKLCSFFVANATQEEAEAIAKKQITFRVTPA